MITVLPFNLRSNYIAFFFLILASCSSKKTATTTETNQLQSGSFKGLSILQGATDETSTQISIVVPVKQEFHYKLTDGSREIPASVQKRITRKTSEWAVDRLKYKGLQIGRSYELQVRNAKGELIDERELRSLHRASTKVRFVLVSCLDDTYVVEQKQMWEEATGFEPQLIIMNGDTIYADKRIGPYVGPASIDTVWDRHVETRNILELYRMKKLIPILAAWDDHDYGLNNGDATYAEKVESKKVFESFFAQEAIPGVLEKGPGISSIYTGFGQRFILTDDRTFRSKDVDEGISPEAETHWGAEQEKWIVTRLNEKKFGTWLFNGDEMFGGYAKPFESYEGNHPHSFKKMIKQIMAAKSAVVFGTGDRHLIEMMRIAKSEYGYETFELVTSAMHAKVFPSTWDKYPNPRQVEGATMKFNYMVIDSSAIPGGLEFEVQGMGQGKDVLFKRTERVLK